MSYYQNYPKVEIKPLNFDDTMTDDEQDENNGPVSTCIADEDVKDVSDCSEKMLLNESSFLDSSTNSFIKMYRHLPRPDYLNSTPGPIRIMRKRKHCEPVTSRLVLPHMPNEILDRVFLSVINVIYWQLDQRAEDSMMSQVLNHIGLK
uniref:Uncharacterized protein n=1 Tax=Panagrolaimus superbus TaxID=310955 RepID=A0A914XZW6_9BILA